MFSSVDMVTLYYVYVCIYIQGDSRSFTPTYGAYSWGNLVQNLLINLGVGSQ
jgi:hypothetical protein